MTKIARNSLLSLEEYAKQRPQIRAEAMRLKRIRSVYIGPNMTLQFENEATIRYQIQEMLRIEKTFEEAGIVDELDAYRNELCTGLFLARTSAAALAALEQVIHVIVRPRKLGACLPLHVPLIQVLTKKRVVGYTAGPS